MGAFNPALGEASAPSFADNSLIKAVPKKKVQKEIATTLNEAAGSDLKPKDVTPEKIEKVAAGDSSGNKKLYMALAAVLPTILGAAIGGARGGQIGAEQTGNMAAAYGKSESEKEQASKDQAAKLEQIEAAALTRSDEKQSQQAFQAQQNALQRDALRGQQDDRRADREAALSEKKALESTVDGRTSKLNSTDKARLDNLKMGLTGIQGMDAALTSGDNTFSIIGDNDFTRNQRDTAEAFGRMQSGGAINKDEEERFIAAGPGLRDSKEIQRKKLLAQRDMFTSRAKTLGFTAEELGLDFEVTYGGGGKDSSGVPDFDNMSAEDLKKYVGQ